MLGQRGIRRDMEWGWVYRETGEEQVVGESTELRMYENAIRNLLFYAN